MGSGGGYSGNKANEGSGAKFTPADLLKRLSLKKSLGKDGDAEKNNAEETSSSRVVGREPASLSRTGSIRIRTVDLVKKTPESGDSVSVKVGLEELPLNSERLESLTTLCFPGR